MKRNLIRRKGADHMNMREEINMMVKVAQAAKGSYVSGRSIGTGYTGNEIRHGGTYATPPGGKPHSQIGTKGQGEAIYSDGNGGRKTYGQLASTQMMDRWNQAAKGGPKSKGWKDYVANSKQEAGSYTPNNPYQYTYAGSQTMADQATAGDYGQRQDETWNEFGAPVNDMNVPGSKLRGRGMSPASRRPIANAKAYAPVKLPVQAPKQVAAPQPAAKQPAQPPAQPSLSNEGVGNAQWADFTGINNIDIKSPYSGLPELPGMYPLQPSRPVRTQIQQSISDEDVADINDYVKNLQNSPDPLVADATKSTYSADRYLRANGLDTLEDLFR